MRLLIVLSLLVWTTLAHAAAHTNGPYVVTLVGNQDPDVVARDHGAGVKLHGNHRAAWRSALHGFAATLTGDQADKVERDSRVQFIEPDVTVLTNGVPTGVRRIGSTNNAIWIANDVAAHSRQIAIIDTGIDLTHPNLNVISNISYVTGAATGNDDNGHGSHCAGIAAGKGTNDVYGVCPGAKLWAVKVLDSAGSGYLSQIISGVDYVSQHADQIEVANMSLGGLGFMQSLQTAISNCVARGVVVVVAAGNSSADIFGSSRTYGASDNFFPACFPECMAVAALTDTDGQSGGLGSTTTISGTTYYDDSKAFFSNYSSKAAPTVHVYSPGNAIDVQAPGVNIYSTYKGGAYATMSGTSMASPHVAGAVALYIAANARATTAAGVWAIRQALVNAAKPNNLLGRNYPLDAGYNDYGLPPLVWCGAAVSGTTPVVTITSPRWSASSGETINTNTAFTFTATAVDGTDGDIKANLVWYERGVGLLGTGASVTTNWLAATSHLVTATVTNSQGNPGSSFSRVSSVLPARFPTITVTAPTAGATVASPVTFTGTANDSVDGDLSSSIQWTEGSKLYGIGANITCALASGSHSVTARVPNSINYWQYSTVTFTVSGVVPPDPPVNYNPVVSITQPTSGSTFLTNIVIRFTATATDAEDGDLSANVNWVSSLDGTFAQGASVTTNLTAGTHTITASVKDSSNAAGSDSHTVTITVAAAPAAQIVVTAGSDRASYPAKAQVYLYATNKVNTVATAGVTNQFQVTGANGKVVNGTAVSVATTGKSQFKIAQPKNKLGSGTANWNITGTKSPNTPGSTSGTFIVQ